MKHILERHHPQYWDSSVKTRQSFLDPRMKASDIQEAIREILKQNREQLIKMGTNAEFQITGIYNEQSYVLGIVDGRIGQLYPLTR